jgi:hypothetical protein
LIGVAVSVRCEGTVATTIRGASQRGALAGVIAAAGGSLADLALIGVLGAIVLAAPGLFASPHGFGIWLGLVAGAVLVLLGWGLMDDRTGEGLSRERGEEFRRAWVANPILDRFVDALLSPWRQVFWWTAGLRLVALAAVAGGAGIAAFAAGIALTGIAWPAFVAARLSDSRRERALSDRQYRVVTSMGGLTFAAAGLWTATAALAGSGLRGLLERIATDTFG